MNQIVFTAWVLLFPAACTTLGAAGVFLLRRQSRPCTQRILFGMAAHPGRVFTRENLLELAVGREFSRYDRSVDMHISTLRRKLGDDPHNPAYLKTIRGMGYTLLPEEA